MSLELSYFRVTITAAGLGGAAPADGFIDNETPREYSKTVGFPSTESGSLAKTRANIRWKEIIQRLSLQITPQIMEITKIGAGPDTAPTQISFTLVYDREDFLYTTDEVTHTALIGENAIRRDIARALTNNVSHNIQVYVPSVDNFEDRVQWVFANGIAANIAEAEAHIVVARVPNT
jgi:hypothetical protein